LITSGDERARLAELNLLASKQAKGSVAYASALTYLVAGAALLPEDAWESRPDLAFVLELQRAECEFLTGALGKAEQRLAELVRRARNLPDLAAVTRLREELFLTLGRSDRAVAVCLEYLRHVGVEWLAHPTKKEVQQE
jgi:predicted ATPase